MKAMESPKLPIVSLILLATMLLAAAAAAAAPPLSKPGCPPRCGNVSVPCPFGTSLDCSLDKSFLITCNNTHYNPSKPFLGPRNTEVLDIDLGGQLRVPAPVASDCYDGSGPSGTSVSSYRSFEVPQFFISSTLNKFTAVGCDTVAVIQGSVGRNYSGGCLAFCNSFGDVLNGTCSGVGCCRTFMPPGATDYRAVVTSTNNYSYVKDFNRCGYAFVAEEASFDFSSLDLHNLRNRDSFPVVLDWAVGNKTCQEASEDPSSYACRAEHSEFHDSTNGQGYLCKCSSGYQGNPYLIDGCRDTNECETLDPCYANCINLPGSFTCTCPIFYDGDGMKNGTGCSPKHKSKKSTILQISLSISIGLLVLVLGSSWIYWMLKKRKHMKRREMFFKLNGGLILKQRLSKQEGSAGVAKIFTAEDLEKATNNYDQSRIIGQGGYGTVYKGLLPDSTVVAIKKSKVSDQSQIKQFINEVVVLSQINHRNVVKLLGCCLETEVPLLVYEFITNGTLSEHIHNVEGRAASLSWEIRLKIAAEAAGAVAYLHSATSPSIIHRDIKSANVLLDNSYSAKVSDFGASRLVPLDTTQITTLVQGTLGYLDPEYFHSSQLTEKSHVYSFGVLLAELLTGERALSFVRHEKDRNLAMLFVSSMSEGCLFQILDKKMVTEGNLMQLKEVAELTKWCLSVKKEERPTMKEVTMELEGLIRMKEKHPWVNEVLHAEEAVQLLNHNLPSGNNNGGCGVAIT